jgi:hypothetical protein
LEQEGSKYLEISVIDSGIGIDKKDHGKLFKLFGFVSDSEHMNTKGIGLGLMIADQIVKQYNGSITFDSELEKGSTFTFKFMLSEEKSVHNESVLCKEDEDFKLNSNDLVFKWKPEEVQSDPNALIQKSGDQEPSPVKYIYDLDAKLLNDNNVPEASLVAFPP